MTTAPVMTPKQALKALALDGARMRIEVLQREVDSLVRLLSELAQNGNGKHAAKTGTLGLVRSVPLPLSPPPINGKPTKKSAWSWSAERRAAFSLTMKKRWRAQRKAARAAAGA